MQDMAGTGPEGMGHRADVPPVQAVAEREEEFESRIFVASQWQLMWWRFRKNKVAIIGGLVVACYYLLAAFVEFLAPYPTAVHDSRYLYAPPQRLHLFDTSNGLRFDPHVYGYKSEMDPFALRLVFSEDPTVKIRVGFFQRGEPYKLLGFIPATRRLIRPLDGTQPMFLLGGDRLGRDVLSRLIHGTRISMSIGLIGVTISLVVGILVGGVSGYYGGTVDMLIQRVIEFIRAMPTIPLWMSLAAALPLDWPPLRVYLGITIILSLVGWTGLARVVRGRFLALREEDFVMAAKICGASELRIIVRHMVPAFTSHIITSLTLAIPTMILSETSLSFLGLGLRPPVVSWGVLLKDAQNVRTIVSAPWLLTPALFVVVAVLALNFLGDGLRDAADPYAR